MYIVAESWLNKDASNDNRGKALSFYMTIQMAGVVAGQGLGDVDGCDHDMTLRDMMPTQSTGCGTCTIA